MESKKVTRCLTQWNCDETPFIMSGEKDATDPQSKDYMWVYHSPGTDNSKKIYIYDYDNGSRSTEVKNFLGNYKGIIVSDGYVSYHTMEKANDLNPFEYFKYLMDQLKEYPRNNVPKEKLLDLMPWFESIPDWCKQLKIDN